MSEQVIDDSGPAFPQHIVETRDGAIQCSYDAPFGGGMSLRDYFAAKALPSALALEVELRRSQIAPPDFRFDFVAMSAYRVADAMLKARNQEAALQKAEGA